MQRLAQLIWSTVSRWHVGDLAWEQAGRKPGWPTALWGEDAWGLDLAAGELGLCADPASRSLASGKLSLFGADPLPPDVADVHGCPSLAGS